MAEFSRRDALKAFGAAGLAAAGGTLIDPAGAADLKYTPEKGAETPALVFAQRRERRIFRALNPPFRVERGLPVPNQPDHAA